jgi:hypothetical protein
MTTPDAAAVTPGDGVVPDFTIRRPPIRFTIDDDTFSVSPITSPFTLRNLVTQAKAVGLLDLSSLTDLDSVLKAIDTLSEIMLALMPGESGRRFSARLNSEGRDADPEAGRPEADPPPIDLMGQAIPAFYYVLEKKGLRPTVPSSPSPTGSTDGQTNTPSDGTSSTAGASPTASGRAVVDLTSPTGLI